MNSVKAHAPDTIPREVTADKWGHNGDPLTEMSST